MARWSGKGCTSSTAVTSFEFTLRVLPVSVPHRGEGCLLVLFESKDWPAWSAGSLAQDDGVATNANRDAVWLRAGVGRDQTVSSVHRGRAGGRRPGTARRA